MSNARNIFDKEQEAIIISAIKKAENKTSGEIRVHVENNCKVDPVERAGKLFKTLKMHETAERNGVLIYLAVKDRKFAIIGDEGIDNAVPENFWMDIKNRMQAAFKEGAFVEGVTTAVLAAGQQLKQFFPYQSDDKNELPDDISFSD